MTNNQSRIAIKEIWQNTNDNIWLSLDSDCLSDSHEKDWYEKPDLQKAKETEYANVENRKIDKPYLTYVYLWIDNGELLYAQGILNEYIVRALRLGRMTQEWGGWTINQCNECATWYSSVWQWLQ